MTKAITQDIITNKGFYVLESPQKDLFWGLLTEDSQANSGSFVDFYQNDTIYLEKPLFTATEKVIESKISHLDLRFKSPDKNSYKKRFTEFQKQKEVVKAVLYENFIAEHSLILDEYLYCLDKLLKLKTTFGGYIYGFCDPKNNRAFLGLSPEYLFYTDKNKKCWTTAVAGSQKKSKFITWSQKLKNEHKLVEDGIKGSLSESIVFGEAENKNYGELVHLHSKAEVFDELLTVSKKLHPTAAVGTLPNSKNLELGPEPRGYFGGYAELLSVEFPFSLVTIRGLEWSKGQVKASIGGGVLHESTLDEEWAEIAFKWEQFKKLWAF